MQVKLFVKSTSPLGYHKNPTENYPFGNSVFNVIDACMLCLSILVKVDPQKCSSV